MKLNLKCKNDIRDSYINIDNFPSQLSPEIYKQGDIQSLDWITENDTVQEIVAIDCLQDIPMAVVKDAIQNWTQKLQSGGILKIQTVDMHIAAAAFVKNQLSLGEFAGIIFGSQRPDNDRKSIMDMMTLCRLLQELGLTIKIKRYDGIALYVEAKK